jgi:hypothetical protein
LNSYWKVCICLPTIEGWEGEPAEEDGYTIYPIVLSPFNRIVTEFNIPEITEFSCTSRYKQKFTANFDLSDHYITTYPLTDIFYHDGEHEQQFSLMQPEFRVLFGRYTGERPISLTEVTSSVILEKGDAAWFLFEVKGDLDGFKLLGMTSDPESPQSDKPFPSFLNNFNRLLKELTPHNPQLRRQLFTSGLKRILWSLADSPKDWSLAIWITHIGLRMYAWDLADGLDFEDAAEYDINNITFETAFHVE